MGPEKRGYVRCIGKMPSVKDNSASSSTDAETVEQRLTQTEGVVNTIVTIIKQYIPNADLTGVLNSVNIEIPDDVSMDQNNSPNANRRSSSESHCTRISPNLS